MKNKNKIMLFSIALLFILSFFSFTYAAEEMKNMGNDIKNTAEDIGNTMKDGAMDAGETIKDSAQKAKSAK